MNSNRADAKTIAIVAYACDSGAGSEPGAGGRIALAAAKMAAAQKVRCIVLTRAKHVANLERQLRDEGLDGYASAVGVQPTSLADRYVRDGTRLHALTWQWSVHRWLRRIQRVSSELVIHHVTFASDVLPSAVHLPGLSKSRKIWGPVGSSDARLEAGETSTARLVSAVKSRWFRVLASRVDLVVCQTGHVAGRLRATGINTVVEQNCIVPDDFGDSRDEELPRQFRRARVAVVGVLTDRKRPSLAIDALRETSKGRWQLVLVGDGPLRNVLERENSDLVEAGLLRFTGWLPREEARSEIAKCVGLIHASVREGAPWAIAEALTQGKWVATIEGNGADYLVGLVEAGGIVVPNSRKGLGAALGNAVIELLDSGRTPSAGLRWSASRFDHILETWYWPSKF